MMLDLIVALAGMLSAQSVPEYGYRVVNVYPHDASAFTQGLEYRAGFLYEGTGLEGQSRLRKVELTTGKVVQEIRLGSHYFGEGITVINQRIVQLTYRTQRGFVYDQHSFKLIRTFDYPGEGWGLTNDRNQIFMSDGTSDIRIWDANTFAEKRRMRVRDNKGPVASLNELEIVNGEIFANVWQTDRIARISPSDGRVTGWIHLTGLSPAGTSPEAVLNGIAHDGMGGRLFVTGKLWPKLYEIQIVPKKR